MNLNSEKFLILAPSDQKYLLGILQSFSLASNSLIEQCSFDCSKNFIQILLDKKPSLLFIGLESIKKMASTVEWQKIVETLKNSNTVICGLGDHGIIKNIDSIKQNISKIFGEPLEIHSIINFLRNHENTFKERRHFDRRQSERRLGDGRRISDIENCALGNTSNPNDRHTGTITSNFPEFFCSESLSINFAEKKVFNNKRQVDLSPKEFQIISLLARKAGMIVSVDEIIQAVWKEKKCCATKADVHQYLYILRHKLEKDPSNPRLLVTVRGFGYKLCCEKVDQG